MKKLLLSALAACATASSLAADEPRKISLPVVPGLTRADIYIVPALGDPAGTLILCPGRNGNGSKMASSAEWSAFARRERLNLVGLSFASDDNPGDGGYFKAEAGSGKLLLDGLTQALGPRQKPLLFYGFSRGAQFTYSFVHWKPDLVMTWCAYSATEWESPEVGGREPRGIIGCGDEDEPNYSSAIFQFLKGRSAAEPWTWVSIAHVGHSRSPALEQFARTYFTSVLHNPGASGLWCDVDTKAIVETGAVQEHPTLAAWLPDENSAEAWRKVHQP